MLLYTCRRMALTRISRRGTDRRIGRPAGRAPVAWTYQVRSIGIEALVVADERAQDVRLSSERARLPLIQIRADEVGGPDGRPINGKNGDSAHRKAVLSQ